MQTAPLPPDEAERIAMLHSLALLDTPTEAVFDRITRLVAHTLNVPIALVTLIDTDRQWFKSKFGIEGTETSREVAFCAHAILETSAMVVPDALLDERFADNPFVTSGPNVRFYAGVPIRTSGGHALGTLCAVDDKPRTLTEQELGILNDLAFLVSKEIQLRETLALTQSSLQTSEQVVEESESRFRTIFEKAAVGIGLVASTGEWLSVNDELCAIVGYSREELAKLTYIDITHPDDLDADLSYVHQLLEGKIDRYQMEKRYIRKNGELIWINLGVTKQLNAAGEFEYFVSIIKNIQAVKEAEHSLAALRHDLEERVIERTQELSKANEMLSFTMAQQVKSAQDLHRREQELRMVIENANDAYICIDESGVVSAWNQQAEETFGWKSEEAIGKRLDQMIIPQHMHGAHNSGMKHYMLTGEATVLNKRIELPAVCRNGKIIPVEVRITALEVNGQTIFSAFLHDITERKELEAKREREALQDSLTGLPNRRAFTDRLPLAMARTDRNRQPMALLFIDLDGFKQVNDTYGHDAGDVLLREVANRLSASVRQTDTVVRMAGDEFTVILEGMSDSEQGVRFVADKILEQLSLPIALGNDSTAISASIGGAIYSAGSGKLPEQLVKAADTAMYEAKRAGKKQLRLSVD